MVRLYSEAVIDWLTDAETRQWPAPGEKPPEIRAFVRALQRDGIPIDDEGHLLPGSVVSLQLGDLSLLEDPAVIAEHLRRIGDNVDQDPAAAIGSAKELVESVCRVILKDYGETVPNAVPDRAQPQGQRRDGRRPLSMPGSMRGVHRATKGQRYPADPPRVEEIIATMPAPAMTRSGCACRL